MKSRITYFEENSKDFDELSSEEKNEAYYLLEKEVNHKTIKNFYNILKSEYFKRR
ncbi:MAG: hypothetical protein ACFFAQ_14155 [Promethearchaeota archaeon]